MCAQKVSIREGELKFVANLEGGVRGGWPTRLSSEELYDLSRDPFERNNIASVVPDRLVSFQRRFHEYMTEAERRRGIHAGSEIVLDEEMIDKLEALGYVVRE